MLNGAIACEQGLTGDFHLTIPNEAMPASGNLTSSLILRRTACVRRRTSVLPLESSPVSVVNSYFSMM
jgi:hypothetical protein